MSYIEKKYREEINGLFNDLTLVDQDVLKTLEKRSLQEVDFIAKLCSEVNKKINLILKKYYPEIKDMTAKLDIKSSLKFYYDLIDSLTHFIMNIENFQKIDDKYFQTLIDFLNDKESLISGKYRQICTQELTAFYDKKSKDHLEEVLAEKFARNEKRFFAMGPLEEEIKKIGKVAGADEVTIFSAEIMRVHEFDIIDNPSSIINYSIFDENEEKLKNIGRELRDYLTSKGYKAAILLVELTDLSSKREVLTGSIITDAKLLPDN